MCCRRLFVACIVLAVGAGTVMSQPPEPKPGPEHAYLKKIAGTWDCTMNMMGQKFQCTHKSEMMGEFWCVGKFSGDLGGMKFEGRDACGYDPAKKQYISTWIDTMSPTMMTMTGTYDAASKTMTMEGMGMGSEGKMVKHKQVNTWKSDDEFTFTMSEEKDGKMVDLFTIDYKRKK